MKRIIVILFLIVTSIVFGQTGEATLKFGSKAPEIKAIWIKGEPVNKFEKDKLYLLEFWATWCGPCIAAMPHLSEIAQKYKDQIEIIGVNVWEKSTEEQPYDSFLPAVEEFVKSMGKKMDYHVAMDNNELYMSKEWMLAANQQGIPASFLIKDGIIIWIGHPHYFEPILKDVLAGDYAMDATAREYEESRAKSEKQIAPFLEMNKKVEDALKQKNYNEALSAIDEGMNVIDPLFHRAVKSTRFKVFLLKNPNEAREYMEQLLKEEKGIGSSLIYDILEIENLPHYFYDFALEILTENEKDKNAIIPFVIQKIAKAHFLKGDNKRAEEAIRKAIDSAKQALKENKFEGRVTSSTIKNMEEELELYTK